MIRRPRIKHIRPGDVIELKYNANVEPDRWIVVALRRRDDTLWESHEWDVLVLDDPRDGEEGLVLSWPLEDLKDGKRL